MFVYVIMYTLWLKRSSTCSTSIGGLSGAMPPVIGYVAVTGRMDLVSMAASSLLGASDPQGRRLSGWRISAFAGCEGD